MKGHRLLAGGEYALPFHAQQGAEGSVVDPNGQPTIQFDFIGRKIRAIGQGFNSPALE